MTGFTKAVAATAGGGSVVVGPGGSSNALSFTYLGGGGAIGTCDPLASSCGSITSASGGSLLAPGGSGDDRAAVGQSRMPDLRGRLRATWDGSVLTVRLRVSIARAKLARAFDVELRGQDFARTVRVRARGRASVLVLLRAPLSDTPSGRVRATIDPGERVTESRERNNTASARIRLA